jgi:hypothetical protein
MLKDGAKAEAAQKNRSALQHYRYMTADGYRHRFLFTFKKKIYHAGHPKYEGDEK